MGSSTINCIAPLAKVIHEKFGIREGKCTLTSSQSSVGQTIHNSTGFTTLRTNQG